MCIRDSHYWGYRNFEAPDASTNISPWGILIAGEELHNNHHCLLYTSDAADERSSVDLGGRRIIKKKNNSELRIRNITNWRHMNENSTKHNK